jgi:hypothetical protein
MICDAQVLIRVCPINSTEMVSQAGSSKCLRQESPHTLTWVGQPETPFTFDHVVGETISQVDHMWVCRKCEKLAPSGLWMIGF